MDISRETETRLIVARQAIQDLSKTATAKADSGKLEPDLEALERDVSTAGNRFLVATKDERLLRGRHSKKVGRGSDPKLGDGWVTLRFRITLSQREIIMAAMERAKEMADVEGRGWKGVALEYVAADYLASHGMPSKVPAPENPRGPENA
jgi:hypothetical protein